MSAQPFLGTEAIASGVLSAHALTSRYERIYRNVYVPKGVQLDAANRAVAAWLWSDRQGIAMGLSAAALHGSDWIDARLPAELYRRNGKRIGGIVIHRDELRADEMTRIRGVGVTTLERTAFDLGRRQGRTRALIRLDALANASRLKAVDVRPLIKTHRGVRGLVQLRDVLDLMDGGSESPQETRTRLVLIDAGLPRPQTQICLGRWRVDMGYEEFKVAIEYDGAQHWEDPDRRTKDIDKYAELSALGWVIIRVGADMLRYRKHVIVERVCAALRQAGAQWPVIGRILGEMAA